MDIPTNVVGVRLYKHVGDDLVGCEAVRFVEGSSAVDTVLRRAAISGRVEMEGEIVDHFADLLDKDQDIIATVALDAKSYRALKTRWMRCKIDRA